jgi:hypothetical protein
MGGDAKKGTKRQKQRFGRLWRLLQPTASLSAGSNRPREAQLSANDVALRGRGGPESRMAVTTEATVDVLRLCDARQRRWERQAKWCGRVGGLQVAGPAGKARVGPAAASSFANRSGSNRGMLGYFLQKSGPVCCIHGSLSSTQIASWAGLHRLDTLDHSEQGPKIPQPGITRATTLMSGYFVRSTAAEWLHDTQSLCDWSCQNVGLSRWVHFLRRKV